MRTTRCGMGAQNIEGGILMYTAGPIVSRRLGVCLGIDNLAGRFCSYNCVYCHFGRGQPTITRQHFISPGALVADVRKKLVQVPQEQGKIDYLVFASGGEPTLDLNLGKAIELLKKLGYPVAVFTNGSLLWIDAVREALSLADWICVKMDTVDEMIWRGLNRPAGQINFAEMLQGVVQFVRNYSGTFVSETTLVKGFNERSHNLARTARFLEPLSPTVAYLSTPAGARAEIWAGKPPVREIYRAHRIFSQYLPRVELLAGEKEFAPGTR